MSSITSSLNSSSSVSSLKIDTTTVVPHDKSERPNIRRRPTSLQVPDPTNNNGSNYTAPSFVTKGNGIFKKFFCDQELLGTALTSLIETVSVKTANNSNTSTTPPEQKKDELKINVTSPENDSIEALNLLVLSYKRKK
jgi:hypothetical protein